MSLNADIEAMIEGPYGYQQQSHGGYRDDRKRRRSRSRSQERRERRREDRDRREREREREREERRRREMEAEERKRREEESKRAEEDSALCDRGKRAVFVYSLHPKVNEDILKDFFAKAGAVREIRIITDRKTGRSKGIAYVEFYDPNSVIGALALQGIELMGHPVMVKPSEADKNVGNVAPSQQKRPAPITQGAGATRLYIGNLHPKVTERDLESVFEELGPVVDVQLQREKESGKSRGYAYLKYKHGEDAKKALVQLNTSELCGKRLKVGLVSESTGKEGLETPLVDDESLPLNARGRAILMSKLLGSGPSVTASGVAAPAAQVALPGPMAIPPNPAAAGLPSIPGGIPPTMIGATATLQPPQPAAQIVTQPPPPPSANALGGFPGMGIIPGMGLGGMQPGVPQGQPPQQQPPPVPAAPIPEPCIMLKNLFDPTQEQEPDFDEDVKEDVCEECNRFGRVMHVFVDKVNPQGVMYLKFDSAESASRAQAALNQRWFNHRMIAAEFLPLQQYNTMFPGA